MVTKDVPDYGVAVGVPAKVIKYRFPEDIAERIKATEWWNWDRKTLEERFDDFLDMQLFVDKYAPVTQTV